MAAMYKKGDVYKLDLINAVIKGVFTYVVIVDHTHPGVLGFRTLLGKDGDPSIGVAQLTNYGITFVGHVDDDASKQALSSMEEKKKDHLHLWELANAEGHFNSDIELSRMTSWAN